jgi:acetyl-CoA C-acetyltransferase
MAAEDAGAGPRLIEALDCIVAIRSFSDTSWRFASPFGDPKNPPKSLARTIGADNARRLVYTYPGGNMVQWCLTNLFELIVRGEIGAALIAGGEALATQKAARRAGLDFDWAEDAGGTPEMWGVETRGWSEVEDIHRMSGAIFSYPMFENGLRGALGRSIDEQRRANGELLARFAAVAADNPLADRRAGYSAEEISTVSADNPYIGFPYTKLMNANAYIDQAAALILTSEEKARTLGIPEDRWIYLHGTAYAHDHWYISDRKNYHSSPATRLVAEKAFAMADMTLDDIDAFDIYSCFPSAIQITCNEFGLPLDDPRGLTVTGGLPYFGGPGNNYVTHSIAEMMTRLRSRPGSKGLITSEGNYVTKHAAGIYSTERPHNMFAPEAHESYQPLIDADKGPLFRPLADGPASVETYTVMHNRRGPEYAIIMGRLEDGSRFIANTPDDEKLLRDMEVHDALGLAGRVSNDGRQNIFTPD